MSTAKKSKPKSPPVPSRSLKNCFEDTKKLYGQYSHASFSKVEIASTLKVSAKSGPFNARVFTLKEFGLIDSRGTDYTISELFKGLKGNTPESQTFKQRAMEAIRRSDTFRGLLDEFRGKLPQQDLVAQRLETQKKFNAERAKIAAAVLENSLRFAGVLDASNNILPVRESHPGSTTSESEKESRESAEPETPTPRDLRMEIPLGNGRKVTISYPGDISKGEVERVSKVLQAIVG